MRQDGRTGGGGEPQSPAGWDAAAVRRLRAHLGLSQAGLAERIGTRQQTISEWETGARAPRRMSRRLLHLVAEASGLYVTADVTALDVTAEGTAVDAHDTSGAGGAPAEPRDGEP